MQDEVEDVRTIVRERDGLRTKVRRLEIENRKLRAIMAGYTEKGQMKAVDVGVRNAGAIFYPDRQVDILTEQVIRAHGHGRWIWCSECAKNVLPALSRPNRETGLGTWRQVICSECGYGLASPYQT
jgi:hypothetical protein